MKRPTVIIETKSAKVEQIKVDGVDFLGCTQSANIHLSVGTFPRLTITAQPGRLAAILENAQLELFVFDEETNEYRLLEDVRFAPKEGMK